MRMRKQYLKKIIKLHPDDVDARSALAKIYLVLQKLGDAEKQLRTTIAIEPDNTFLYTDLGHILERLNKENDALTVF